MAEEEKQPDIGQKVVSPEEMAGYTLCPNALCISRDALVLYGISAQDNGAAGAVTLHEGRNALAPVIMVVNFGAFGGVNRVFVPGIELDRGLFVAFTLNVTSCTVLWRPRREQEA